MRFIFFLFLIVSPLLSNPIDSVLKEIQILDAFLYVDNFPNNRHPPSLVSRSFEHYSKAYNKFLKVHKKLKKIPHIFLHKEDLITKKILELKIKNTINELQHKSYLIPFSSEGGFFNRIIFNLPNLPLNTKEDLENYNRWLKLYPEYLNSYKKLMEKGIQEGILAPKIVVDNAIKLMLPFTSNEANVNPFKSVLSKNLEGSEKIQEKINQTILFQIIPAYQQLIEFTKNEYRPACPDKPGIININNGKIFYENKVKYYSTLNITPDSVFNLGKKEVARIKSQMQAIIDDLKFEGTFNDFLNELRHNSSFYAKSEQELLNYAAWLSKKAEGQLPKYFSNLYELPFTVEPVPLNIAPNYTAGRFIHGSRVNNKPGIYWVNTYDLKSRTLYTLPALTLHEAVPGHHLQIQRAAEIENLNEFRRNYYISAFGEGWGLYAEFLGEEMGMYDNPYDLFGRFTYEMWRACRLVVDVGIHYRDWSREKAVKFMQENTALSLREVNTEIDRYIGWPGQAISYKIGEIVIKELRQKAELELGNKFNIQEFHEIILGNGSVTLPILIENVNQWIKSKE